jgi:hypothetical protein
MNGIPEVLSELERKRDHLAIAIEVLRPYTNGESAPAKPRRLTNAPAKVTLMPGWKQRRRCPHCGLQMSSAQGRHRAAARSRTGRSSAPK